MSVVTHSSSVPNVPHIDPRIASTSAILMQNVHDICPRKMTEFPKFLTDTTREYCAYRCSSSVLFLGGCAVRRRLYACSSDLRGCVKDTISEHKQSDIMHVKNSVDHLTMGQVADADWVRETFPLRVATEKSNFRQIGVNETLGGREGRNSASSACRSGHYKYDTLCCPFIKDCKTHV